MPTDVALLAEVPLFQPLDDQERAVLAAQVEVVSFEAGRMVYNYGDPDASLYVIRSGEAEVFFKNQTGERIVLDNAGPGDFCGELSLLDAGPHATSALALKDLEAIRVDRNDLDHLFHQHPSAALDLLTVMGRRLRVTGELLRRTATRNVNEEMADIRTPTQKAADWIAASSGSIPFLLIHLVIFAVWILLNVEVIRGLPVFDPFPFGLLTMAVSLEAIVLSVFVLLSQNRQAAKDRIRADVEYDVNLKAELEVGQLHEKVDHLTGEVLARLASLERTVVGGRSG